MKDESRSKHMEALKNSVRSRKTWVALHQRAILALVVGGAFTALSPQVKAACVEACLGNESTAFGDSALLNGPNSSGNTAIGFQTLFSTSNGSDNTAVGKFSLAANTSGVANTAVGSSSMQFNTTGTWNTAIGQSALVNNRTGNQNTAAGFQALGNTMTPSNNSAIGFQTLGNDTTGQNNTAIGSLGLQHTTTGSNNIAVGASAGANLTTTNNNIDVGNEGVAGDSGVIRIGTVSSQTSTFVAGIRGVAVAGAQPVVVGATGQLGIRASSARYKEAIKPMDKASESIFSLQPVTFRYKKALDPNETPEFGLVAEQVAKVNPDLVTTDPNGKPLTVRYEEINAMLLNEFLKDHRRLEEQAATIEKLQRALAAKNIARKPKSPSDDN